ncbi:DUF983 domain-containing protein [Actinokineospora sp. NBRC 105648]|uniref:DUF983 domain-containing protein n=1 Tax=Actinokineospora sp. NBRC 105648 TaxID=3032206 RepID=UPI0024A12D2A|nr:DUF983 domain-containing protein [Actinokineospora sp. NBRC 105648]GLZ41259.1 hypothetical protein Acsp05_48830 [Actinokineospora sp. NBRC 105648]
MTRQVRDVNGRLWTVHGTLEWRTPATEDDFEHDVAAGYVPGVVMLAVIGVLAIVLLYWTPAAVVVPAWLVFLLFLLALFFPARWAARRPWTLVAETGDDGDGEATERWMGTVRGYFTARGEIARIAKEIGQDTQPSYEGVLKPIT